MLQLSVPISRFLQKCYGNMGSEFHSQSDTCDDIDDRDGVDFDDEAMILEQQIVKVHHTDQIERGDQYNGSDNESQSEVLDHDNGHKYDSESEQEIFDSYGPDVCVLIVVDVEQTVGECLCFWVVFGEIGCYFLDDLAGRLSCLDVVFRSAEGSMHEPKS